MIEIEGLKKSFATAEGVTEVLHDVSLHVEAGEIFGIIGRSGAGKSTLVRCMNLLERPTSGRIVVNGREMTGLDEAALRQARRDIGMIFQHFNLLSSRTVFANVALPLELAGRSANEIREQVEPLLELVGLVDKRDRYPAELSGGQKQRVGIARALASRPAVLLCDEATSALDPETTKSILALLKDINARFNLTICLITHEMPVIKQICDRVAVLDDGRIAEQGNVFDIFTRPTAEVTKSFLKDLLDPTLPEIIRDRLQLPPTADGNPVLRLIYTGPSAHAPIIAEIVRRFDVVFNILQGNVEYIQGEPYGNIVVEAIGSGSAIQDAVDYIRANNLEVEVLGHVASSRRAVA